MADEAATLPAALLGHGAEVRPVAVTVHPVPPRDSPYGGAGPGSGGPSSPATATAATSAAARARTASTIWIRSRRTVHASHRWTGSPPPMSAATAGGRGCLSRRRDREPELPEPAVAGHRRPGPPDVVGRDQARRPGAGVRPVHSRATTVVALKKLRASTPRDVREQIIVERRARGAGRRRGIPPPPAGAGAETDPSGRFTEGRGSCALRFRQFAPTRSGCVAGAPSWGHGRHPARRTALSGLRVCPRPARTALTDRLHRLIQEIG